MSGAAPGSAETSSRKEGGNPPPATFRRQDWAGHDFNVPTTLPRAVARFLREPSVALVCSAIAAGAIYRLKRPFAPADAVVALLVAAGWILQEWVVHRYLLHCPTKWLGSTIHARHHAIPFHHVSIDGPRVILPAMAASAALFRLLFLRSSELALTATLAYYGMGLLYEWTHYLVHTRVPLLSPWAAAIKKHHVQHHVRDSRCWMSFTCPPLDTLLGTVPGARRGRAPPPPAALAEQ